MISFLLVILNFIYVLGHYHTSYSHEGGLSSYENNWQEKLHDHVKINKISLPGTHDTMTYPVHPTFADMLLYSAPFGIGYDEIVTQNTWLYAQLDAGIRALDIRIGPDVDSDQFFIYHGDIYLGSEFGADVLDYCTVFLDRNPTEFILMGLKVDHNPSDVSDEGLMTIMSNTYYDNPKYSSYFYKPLDDTVPKVEAVRGKIVILQHFAEEYQIGLIYYKNNIQDYYDLSSNFDLYNKWEKVKAHLYSAEFSYDIDINTFYINYFSGHGISFPYFVASGHSSPGTSAPRLSTGTVVVTVDGGHETYPDFPPTTCAGDLCTISFEGINTLTYDFINGHLEFVGICYIDFPGQGLIDTIIDTNFRRYDMHSTLHKIGEYQYGEWGRAASCPDNEYAIGFGLMFDDQGGDDEGALTVVLHCGDPKVKSYPYHMIYTDNWMDAGIDGTSYYGKWDHVFCDYENGAVITGFQAIDGYYSSYGMVNIRATCSDGSKIIPHDGYWDSIYTTGWYFERTSQPCEAGYAICEYEQRIDKTGTSDDSGLNQLKFHCCTYHKV